MFCKHCGAAISDGAGFCSSCGKSQVTANNSRIGNPLNKPARFGKTCILVVSLILMLLTGIYYRLRMAYFFEAMNTDQIVWIYTAVGILSVFLLWIIGIIRPEKLNWEVLCLPIIFFILMHSLSIWNSIEQILYSQIAGTHHTVGMVLGINYSIIIEELWGANALWLWGLLVLFLCLRSGKWNFRKYVHIAVLSVLLVWSVILYLFSFKFLRDEGVPAEFFSYARDYCCNHILGMFVRRSVCYFFVYYAGIGRLKKWRILLFPILILLGSCLLTLINTIVLHIDFFRLAHLISTSVFTLSHLFGLLVLIKMKAAKKQCKFCGEDIPDTDIFCKFCGMELSAEKLPEENKSSAALCAHCGCEVADGEKYCIHCGSCLNSDNQQCSYCGAKLRDGASFCSECGKQQEITKKKRFPSLLKNRKIIMAAALILMTLIITFVCIRSQPKNAIVGVWMDGTNKVTFTRDGDFKLNNGSYGTYTVDKNDQLTMQFGEYSYYSGRWEYTYGKAAKDNSNYWYISAGKLYFRGKEYTKQ